MRNARLSARLTLLAAALAAGAVACGSPGSPASSAGHGTPVKPAPPRTRPAATAPPATTLAGTSAVAGAGPLAGLTGYQVVTRAVADTRQAPVVRVTGTTSDSGQSLSLDVTLVRGKGCQGSISGGTGSFRFVYAGTTFWILPDEKFYRSQGAPASVIDVLNGKYLKVKASDSRLGAMVSFCSISTMLGGFRAPGFLSVSAPTTFDGEPALILNDAGDTAYVYVSYTARPELLQVVDPASGGTLDFGYDSAAAITPPPASEVIDGSKYGF